MRGFHPLGVFKRSSPDMLSAERQSIDISDIPENRQKIIDDSLEKLGITMYSGALRSSVCNVAGALIMQRESGEETPAGYLQKIIDGSMRDLSFHKEEREKCGGDAEKTAANNLVIISRVVQVAYGEIEEIPQNTAEVTRIGETVAA